MIRKEGIPFFFIKLSIFFIFLFLLDFLTGKLLERFYFSQTSGVFYRTTYSIDSTRAELLIFGSSRANHHYVPEVFEDSLGMTYYNTGRDGNGIFYQLAVLKSVLKRYTPKVIILDYYSILSYSPSDYERMTSILPYYRSHYEIRDIIQLRSKFEFVKLYSKIYPFNSQILTIIVGNMEFNKERKMDTKGYVKLDGKMNNPVQENLTNSRLIIDNNTFLAFEEFLKYSKKAGSNLFIVYSPILNVIDREEIEIAKKMAHSFDVPFLDFSTDTTFFKQIEYFQDPEHLNHIGATEFSKKLVNHLKISYLTKK